MDVSDGVEARGASEIPKALTLDEKTAFGTLVFPMP